MEIGEKDQTSVETENLPELHVLGVEDDPSIRRLQEILFEKIGIDYTSTANGQEALERLQKEPNRFNTLFTDYDMPGMNGVELAQKAKELNPRLAIALITARGLDDAELSSFKTQGIDFHLQKPFLVDDLKSLTGQVKDVFSKGNNNEI